MSRPLSAGLVADARALSSGTLGGLTGLRSYVAIERVQEAFVAYCEQLSALDADGVWQAAWSEFWASVRAKEQQ